MTPHAPVGRCGLKPRLARTFSMSSSGLSVSTGSQRSLELDNESDGLAVTENGRHGLLARRAVVAVGGRVPGSKHGRGARGGLGSIGTAPLPCSGKATVVGVVSSLWK